MFKLSLSTINPPPELRLDPHVYLQLLAPDPRLLLGLPEGCGQLGLPATVRQLVQVALGGRPVVLGGQESVRGGQEALPLTPALPSSDLEVGGLQQQELRPPALHHPVHHQSGCTRHGAGSHPQI